MFVVCGNENNNLKSLKIVGFLQLQLSDVCGAQLEKNKMTL